MLFQYILFNSYMDEGEMPGLQFTQCSVSTYKIALLRRNNMG